MSNRGRHKKSNNLKTLYIVYNEIRNFKEKYHFDSVVIYFRNYDMCNHTYIHVDSNISLTELKNILKIRKGINWTHVRVPSAKLVEDKYYKL